MSGRKKTVVRIEESEWRRTQQAAARLRDVRADLPKVIEGVREQARRDAQQAAEAVRQRQRSAEQAIGRLSAQARELESEVNRRLGEQNADRVAVDAEGEELPDVPLDVDYWSHGALLWLRNEVTSTFDLAMDEASPPSTEAMRELVEQRVPAFEQRLAGILEEAGPSQLGSQLRANIADIVVQTMIDNGFSLADATYGGDDYRNAFFAKVEHSDGGEVVVDVSPSAVGPTACELKVLSFDRDSGSYEIRTARALELAAALREHGLDTGVPQPADGEPDARYRDIESIRRTAPGADADAVRVGADPGDRTR
ncbi:hypothetical protein FDG2_6401 [Candidatus Protofrankia californiensis]|uniref:Uncharacterized protein n=1 Tax=Candidatus Protofrankia californiensis TaxID=1839754 RepID=A0A1C3PGU8_9ACTN|nr:hypothetical protein FDG2_6401 [Candidatus Protofrankia californiensis]